MTVKREYIIYAVIIIVAVVGFGIRECVRNRQITQLNERIEQLTETINIQSTQIDEMTARLRAKQAELESANKYCENVEKIVHKSEELNHDIIKTVTLDEKSLDWYQSPVPDDICAILHEQLCDRPCGSYQN